MAEQQNLVEALKSIVDSHWKIAKKPLMLSNLPPLLQSVVADFREQMGGRSLRAFVDETSSSGGYKLIKHPTQRAKIGYIPANENFEFTRAETVSEQSVERHVETRSATLAFIQALKILSEEELTQVHIPIAILVKLVG